MREKWTSGNMVHARCTMRAAGDHDVYTCCSNANTDTDTVTDTVTDIAVGSFSSHRQNTWFPSLPGALTCDGHSIAMAAVQQRLQAHSKTRSAQVAPSSSRSLLNQQHQPQQQQAHHGSGHNAIPAIPPLSLFLRNLKLLDLDLLPDWPGISTEAFVTGTTAQGQKKRIQCVEWALFQLFALWDPEETAKVGTCIFPCMVQSLNSLAETQTLLPAP